LNGFRTKQQPSIVIDKDGVEGTVISDAASTAGADRRLLVRFYNGEQLFVPREMLQQQADGRYRLLVSVKELLEKQESLGWTDSALLATQRAADELNSEQTIIVPVTEEEVTVQKRTVETGRVQIHKTVHEHTEIVDQPLQIEDVEIERVPVNRIVSEAIPVRYEGDTTIISLLEEVLVVEKRLMLREEVHIKKAQRVVHDPQEVLLREERVEVVRKPAGGESARQDKTTAQ
jgi:uncharacterized protein (TIGR02271 family)